MATPARTLTVVPPAEPTSVALRALSPRERQACWRLFGRIVGIYRRFPERMADGMLERVIAGYAEPCESEGPKS